MAVRETRVASGRDVITEPDVLPQALDPGVGPALEREVPPETIAISASETKWENQKEIIQGAADFHAAGGKLLRLEFPRTEIQRYGDVAMLYSQYVLETEMNGKRSTEAGRATEIFVLRDGRWVNPGWHTDKNE